MYGSPPAAASNRSPGPSAAVRGEIRPLQIVSGGQTGVDRGALDAALAQGADCGGWCPQDRKAEDGVIAARYPLTELAGGDYIDRTRKNVEDSDGTVIIYFGGPGGGTERTLEFCIALGRPYLLLDATELEPARAAARIAGFAAGLPGDRLNFAGPRASGEPRAHAYALDVVTRFIRLARDRAGPADRAGGT